MRSCEDDELRTEWLVDNVALGLLTSVAGAFVALTTMAYARRTMGELRRGFFVASSGFSLGGSAIFCQHVIGMEALRLTRCDGDIVETRYYDGTIVVVSLVAAVLCTAMAMHIVMPAEDDLQNSSSSSSSSTWAAAAAAAKKKPRGALLASSSREEEKKKKNPPRLSTTFGGGQKGADLGFDARRFGVSSFLLTSAALLVHYSGMLSQEGPYEMTYSSGFVLLSALVGVVFAAAGLFIIVEIADMESLQLRVAAAVSIGLAVNALHYAATESATYRYAAGGGKLSTLFGAPMLKVQLDAKIMCIISLAADVAQLSFAHHLVSMAKLGPAKIGALDTLARQQAHEMRNKYAPAMSIMEQFIDMATTTKKKKDQEEATTQQDFTSIVDDVALALASLREVEVQHQARLDMYKILRGTYVPKEETFDVLALMRERVDVERAIAARSSTSSSLNVVDYAFVVGDARYRSCEALHVRTDLYVLTHVASSLLSNARKFTREGRVVITLKEAADDDDTLTFTVTDTGTGIPQGVVDTLFHHEVATGDKRGTGLGLPSCDLFCKASGGYVKLNETRRIQEASVESGFTEFEFAIKGSVVRADHSPRRRHRPGPSTTRDPVEDDDVVVFDDDDDDDDDDKASAADQHKFKLDIASIKPEPQTTNIRGGSEDTATDLSPRYKSADAAVVFVDYDDDESEAREKKKDSLLPHGMLVVVVDDSELNRKIAIRSLTRAQHATLAEDWTFAQFDTVEAAQPFLRKAHEDGLAPIVCLDEQMASRGGVLTGLQATRWLKDLGFRGTIISTSGDPGVGAKHLELGAHLNWGKPLPKQDRIVQDLVGLFNKDNRTGKQESRRHSSGSSSTTTHKKVANDEATFALRPSL